MKPVFQTKFTDRGEKGNCLAACFASLLHLSLDQVPCFEDYDTVEERGNLISLLLIKHRCFWFGTRWGLPPKDNRFYLTSYQVPSIPGINHCVITRNHRIVHDPRGELALPLGELNGYYNIRKVRMRRWKTSTSMILSKR